MRIRSTKPEFFRSKRVSEDIPDWGNRYLLKALESYVDDNGVGKDNVALIAADCFPHDVALDPSGTFQRLPEGLSALFEAGFIHRYEMNGERLLYISWWESTQYVQKPKPGRLPRPDGTFGYKESVIGSPGRKPPEASGKVQPVSGDQVVRGTGEQGYMRDDVASDDAARTHDTEEFALIEPEAAGPSLSDKFEQFYAAYPRKRDRAKAEEAFTKAVKQKCIHPDRIIHAAQQLAADPNLPEPTVIPYPSTWLNAERWDDPPYEPQRPRHQSAADQRLQKGLDMIARRMPTDQQRGISA